MEGDKLMAVEIQAGPQFSSKPPKELFGGNLDADWWPTYDVTSDGKFLMIREGEKPADTGTLQQIILVQNWFEELKRLVPTRK